MFSADFLQPVAQALKGLGCEKAWIVHGAGGLDELSAQHREANTVAILDKGEVTLVRAGAEAEINPDIRGGLAAENAAEMAALLDGGGRPGHRAAVLINAAAALVVAGRARDVASALPIAEHVQLVTTWSFVVMGVMMVLGGTMRAYGVVIAPMVIMVIALFPGRVGFYYLAYPHIGGEAVWWAGPVGTVISASLTYAYYASGRWRKSGTAEVAPAAMPAE